ncbi:MAG: aldo/keto reductase [Clostridia bacterium]|nr:aldo/keto reductase [Clostridia bacterium]MBN2883523.1 aldo/keto reductase [Clostridia bacterium]
MQIIDYGKTGIKTARFGLGCMRLPLDQNKSTEIIQYAIDHGVTYLDTAYIYKDNEIKVGKALENGYREKAILVTKSPVWDIKSYKDFEKFLDEELKRLQTDYIDMYLMHSLGSENFKKVIEFDGFTFLDKMIEKGKILHKGFSYHGPKDLFKEIVDSYDWEMAQIQLNILDEFEQAGLEGLIYAHRKGLATVIMEPLRGGHLVNDYPAEIDELISEFPQKRSLVEWAFRWLYNIREADVIISGVSTIEQLKQNLEIFKYSEYDCMTAEEANLVHRIKEAYEKRRAVGCTGCGYCMPCPFGVEIPEVFRYWNKVTMLEKHWLDKMIYGDTIVKSGKGADKCTECGVCLTKCPQGIQIPEELKKAHAVLMAK